MYILISLFYFSEDVKLYQNICLNNSYIQLFIPNLIETLSTSIPALKKKTRKNTQLHFRKQFVSRIQSFKTN